MTSGKTVRGWNIPDSKLTVRFVHFKYTESSLPLAPLSFRAINKAVNFPTRAIIKSRRFGCLTTFFPSLFVRIVFKIDKKKKTEFCSLDST